MAANGAQRQPASRLLTPNGSKQSIRTAKTAGCRCRWAASDATATSPKSARRATHVPRTRRRRMQYRQNDAHIAPYGSEWWHIETHRDVSGASRTKRRRAVPEMDVTHTPPHDNTRATYPDTTTSHRRSPYQASARHACRIRHAHRTPQQPSDRTRHRVVRSCRERHRSHHPVRHTATPY